MRCRPPLALLAVLALAGCATTPAGHATLAPFHSDGCSLFPDGTPAHPDLWCDCCLRHDLAYWQGGTDDDRLAADRALRACVEARTDDPLLARLVYAAVRVGGPSVFPTGFQWGYGWPYGHGARALGPDERARVEELLQAYLQRNPTLRCAGSERTPGQGGSTRPLRPPAAPAPRLAHDGRAIMIPEHSIRGGGPATAGEGRSPSAPGRARARRAKRAGASIARALPSPRRQAEPASSSAAGVGPRRPCRRGGAACPV